MNRDYPAGPPIVLPLYHDHGGGSSDNSEAGSPARNIRPHHRVVHQRLPSIITSSDRKRSSFSKNHQRRSCSEVRRGYDDHRGQYVISNDDNAWERIPGTVLENYNTEIYVKVTNQDAHVKEVDRSYITICMSRHEKEVTNHPTPMEEICQCQVEQNKSSSSREPSQEPPKVTPRRTRPKKIIQEDRQEDPSLRNTSFNRTVTEGNLTDILNPQFTLGKEEDSSYIQPPQDLARTDCEMVNYPSVKVEGQGELLSGNSVEAKHEQDMNIKNLASSNCCSIGVQVSPSPQYRLRFLPICGCTTVDESEWRFCGFEGFFFLLRLIGRWVLSQCGLGVVLVIWALLGAAAFEATEGPREQKQMEDLRKVQSGLVIELAKDLRIVQPNSTTWPGKIQNYMTQHEQVLLEAVSSGYGEGGGGGKIWSYAGCLLFAVSLLTTLGFGAPVPRTTLGRIAAVIFSAIGIPLHLLLVLNVGMLIAVKLQSLANSWQPGTSLHLAMFRCCCRYNVKKPQPSLPPSTIELAGTNPHHRTESKGTNTRHTSAPFIPPRWLKWFPAVSIFLYYTFGVLVFGVGRSRPFAACMLFPLDFTAAGGVGLTLGPVRVCYAIYLEGAVTLAATCVSVLQISAARGMTELGLKLGILTNS